MMVMVETGDDNGELFVAGGKIGASFQPSSIQAWMHQCGAHINELTTLLQYLLGVLCFLQGTDDCLTDWEHGTPTKITVSDFNFVLKVG